MKSKLPSSGTFPSAGRLDHLCASAKDITPPSKPVRQVTGEYSRGGTVSMPATQTKYVQRKLSQVDWTINPVQESFDTKPSKPARTSSSKRAQSTLFSDNGAAQVEINESLSTCLSKVQCSYANHVNSPRAFFLSGMQSPVISKALVHSANLFFGMENKKKKSLMDDDDCDALLEAMNLFVNDIADGDISDVDDGHRKDDASRWSHSSSGSLDHMSSSAVSMPSKPQRRASLLQTVS